MVVIFFIVLCGNAVAMRMKFKIHNQAVRPEQVGLAVENVWIG
jgi:hypothetical protein